MAATKTWDGGGADDNWQTAANWDLDVAPVAGDALVFAGSTRTTPNNDFAANTSFASITFSNGASSFTLSGNDLTLSGGATAITASNASNAMVISINITFSTAAPTITSTSGGTLTLSGTVANGGFLLTIAGDGVITISGVLSGTGALYINTILDNVTILSGTNTFTGNVTINVGGIRISSASGLGAGAKTITMTNGASSSLRLDASGGDITLPNTLSFNISAASGTYGGIINEAGNSIIQSDMSVPTGGGGVRLMSSVGTISASGTYTPTAAGRVLALYGASNGTFSGTWLDAGYTTTELNKFDAGTWTLTNTGNSYAGRTYIQVGTLKLGAAGVIPDLSTVTGAGTFDMNGYSETVGSMARTGITDIVSAGGTSTLTCGGDNTSTTNSGVIKNTTGTLSLTKVGSGTLTLSGTNTYAGTTTISAGTIAVGAGGTTGAIAGNITNNSALQFNRTNSYTYSGTISGSGTVLQAGSGTTTFSGSNSYTGTTTISAGTLQLGAAGVISNSSNVVLNGGYLSTGSGAGYSETVGTLTLTANSRIALGTGSHSLNFAASDGTAWTGGTLLRITGWQGGFDCSSGTSGKVYTGSSNELAAGKLAQIFFSHPISGLPFTACQLNTGEIVPTSTLPVELVSFNGELNNSVVDLYWLTASEINSDYFEILRSSDAIHFESIGKVEAAGNSNDFISYSFHDAEPLSGYSYYKLVEIDIDGAQQNSKIIGINRASDEATLSIFPNPNEGSIIVSFNALFAGIFNLVIYNMEGQQVYHAMVAANEGSNKFDLSLAQLTAGNYIVELVDFNQQKQQTKITKKE